MGLLNILIVIVIIVFIYIIINKKENNKKDNLYEEEDYSYLDEIFDNIESKNNFKNNLKNNFKNNSIINSKSNLKIENKVKPYYIEMRVHNDYRDTITAFNNVAPDQRPIFNRSVLPVKEINPNPIEVKPLVKAFIKKVNEEVKYNISDIQNENSGWDELAPEKKKDGWGDYQNELGLPESLYNQPAKRAKIRLIKIDTVQKFATQDQLNFIVHMIIQKTNTSDQMIIKVSYVMDNVDLNAERNFNKSEFNVDFNVKIEEIAIVGFLTDHSYGDLTERKDFYQFVNIEKDNIISDEKILKQLKEKYKQRQIESDNFNLIISPKELNNIATFRLNRNAKLQPFEHTNKF
jgi:hypothetical protein